MSVPPAGAPRSGTVARDTVTGTLWAFGSTVAGRVISAVALVVLARLLSPEEFGLLAFATLFITYVETLGDLGTGAALIYWPGRREDAAQATFLVNLAMGATWFLIAWATAPLVASFFHSPAGEPVLRTMAWIFPLKYLANTHDALLQKRLGFKARAIPEMGMSIVKAAVAVTLAYRGFEVWSLVYGHLAGQATASLALWAIVPWRPAARGGTEILGPMLRYGRGIVAVDVLAAVVHHLDRVVVGRAFGAVSLGLYEIAARVPRMTLTVGTWTVGRVLFPAFSKLQTEGERLRQAYLTATRYIGLLALPAATGLALLASPVVTTLFGEEWSDAVPILRFLAVYAGLRAVGTHAGDVLKGIGRSDVLARLAALKAAILVPALVAAGFRDPVTVAATMTAVKALTAAVDHTVTCSYLPETRVRDLVGQLGPAAVSSSILAAFLAGWLSLGAPTRGALGLAASVGAGTAVYLLSLPLVDPGLYRRVRRTLSRKGPEPRTSER